jgi:hypothetical protein
VKQAARVGSANISLSTRGRGQPVAVAVVALVVAVTLTYGLTRALAPDGLLEGPGAQENLSADRACARVMQEHYAAVERRDWPAALRAWDLGAGSQDRAPAIIRALETTTQRLGDLREARLARVNVQRAWGTDICRVIVTADYVGGAQTEIFHLRRREGKGAFQVSQYCLNCPSDLQADISSSPPP